MSLYGENENIKSQFTEKKKAEIRKKKLKKIKFFAAFAVIVVIIVLIFKRFNGNKTIFDFTNNTFNYAIIELPNGTIIEGEIQEWKDYEGDQLQVIFEETGERYLAHSSDCVLIEK